MAGWIQLNAGDQMYAEVGMAFVVTSGTDVKAGPEGEHGKWKPLDPGDIFVVIASRYEGHDVVLNTILHPVYGICTRHTPTNGFRSPTWNDYVKPISATSP